LTVSIHRGTFQILARAIPSWISPELPSYGPVVMHDTEFTTLFNNLPKTTLQGTVGTSAPYAADDRTSVHFATQTDDLDGAVEALCSVYVGGKWKPGFMRPIPQSIVLANGASNALSFGLKNETTGEDGFYETYLCKSYLANRGDAVAYLGVTQFINQMPFGAEQVLGISVQAMRQSSQIFSEYLMSLDTISSKSSGGSKSNNGGGKSRSRKPKGKPMSK